MLDLCAVGEAEHHVFEGGQLLGLGDAFGNTCFGEIWIALHDLMEQHVLLHDGLHMCSP